MASKRFIVKNGLDNNSQTITNVADPVNSQDAATKNFSSNANNITSGVISSALLAATVITTTNVASLTNKTLVGYKEQVQIIGTVSTSTYNIDVSLANIFDITLGANVIFTFTNSPASGYSQPVTIILRQDSTGSRTATFNNAKYTDGATPQLSTGANQVDVLSYFTVNGGSFWFGTFAMANVS